jgi:hypothetical protein
MGESRDDGKRRFDADRTTKLTWQELSHEELRAALAGAKSGSDPRAAMKLIGYFHGRIRDNLPYDQTILLEYLLHAFGRIVDGLPADRALGLDARAGIK